MGGCHPFAQKLAKQLRYNAVSKAETELPPEFQEMLQVLLVAAVSGTLTGLWRQYTEQFNRH